MAFAIEINKEERIENFTSYFENFISSTDREERQYALFLYNKLLEIAAKNERDDEDNIILKACGLLDKNTEIIKIKSVVFEATYLRDIFWRERDETREDQKLAFNRLLFEYVCGLELKWQNVNNNITEHMQCLLEDQQLKSSRNWHDIKVKEEDKNKVTPEGVIKNMMNSKPDIAVVYECEGHPYLKFIECKYTQRESKTRGQTQIEIQNLIARFICEKLLGGKYTAKESTHVVAFVNEAKEEWEISKSLLLPNILK